MTFSGTQFMPDKAITRGEVLNLIWKRNGSKTGISAPSVITSQSDNKDAAAWGYTYGIMTGDDGLNLRLGDTLTRAEGAALSVRAREINENSPAKDFADIVSPDVFKKRCSTARRFLTENTIPIRRLPTAKWREPF
ncbi:MAG: hypothetical protein L6V93_14190 [Clostridiales bacterium]|nr:MAG: hypothetical protein L6V93_14190 [Clostridiales bacterium]